MFVLDIIKLFVELSYEPNKERRDGNVERRLKHDFRKYDLPNIKIA